MRLGWERLGEARADGAQDVGAVRGMEVREEPRAVPRQRALHGLEVHREDQR